MESTAEAGHERVPDAKLVARLLRQHVPELAAERVRPSSTSGSSNWVFRVGEQYAARLPRTDSYAEDVVKEALWVPRLAPKLPVSVPDIVYQGEPCALSSRPWTVVTWVPGELPADLGPAEQGMLARSLGQFMHGLDTHGLGVSLR